MRFWKNWCKEVKLSYEEFLQNGLQQFKEGINKITLLDNIRFFQGEKKNDKSFSQSITNELDLFINEAFSASHRSHASVNQMAKNILSAPGINFSKEVMAINDIKNSSKKKLAIIFSKHPINYTPNIGMIPLGIMNKKGKKPRVQTHQLPTTPQNAPK